MSGTTAELLLKAAFLFFGNHTQYLISFFYRYRAFFEVVRGCYREARNLVHRIMFPSTKFLTKPYFCSTPKLDTEIFLIHGDLKKYFRIWKAKKLPRSFFLCAIRLSIWRICYYLRSKLNQQSWQSPRFRKQPTDTFYTLVGKLWQIYYKILTIYTRSTSRISRYPKWRGS